MDNSAPGEPWNVRRALREVEEAGFRDALPELERRLANALRPASSDWMLDRLTLLGLAQGFTRSEITATAWLHETARLLSDLPEDICSLAIDEAIKAGTRRYVPAVSEIRKHAEPLLAKRRRFLHRIRAMLDYEDHRPEEVRNVTPEEAAAILEQCGFGAIARKMVDRARREPTADDYRALRSELGQRSAEA